MNHATLKFFRLSAFVARGPLHQERHLACMLALLLSVCGARSQGTFQNLGFESSTILAPSGQYAQIPGWTASGGYAVTNYAGGTRFIYNNRTLDWACAALMGTGGYYPVLDGNYSVFLWGGGTFYPYGPVPWTNGASLGQTATIAASAKSVSFWGVEWNDLDVTFDGQPLAVIRLSSTADHAVFGADVTGFAGQTGELLFKARWSTGIGMLDRIQFSNASIPEPRTLPFWFAGTCLLIWRWRQRRDSRCIEVADRQGAGSTR